MPSRRVRQVGKVRWVRLASGERVSQCGRFLLRPPALSTSSRRWMLWYRDPLRARASAWGWERGSPVWSAKLMRDALEAAAVFEAALRRYNRTQLAKDVRLTDLPHTTMWTQTTITTLRESAAEKLPTWVAEHVRLKLARWRRDYALHALAAAQDAGKLVPSSPAPSRGAVA